MQRFNSPTHISQYIAEQNINIFHVHTLYEPYMDLLESIKRLSNTKIVETSVFSRTNPRVERLIDRHLVVSKAMALRFFRLASYSKTEIEQKVSLLYFPIDVDFMKDNRFSAERILDYRKSSNISPQAFVGGKIGRPDPHKFGGMLSSVMSSTDSEIHFVILGPPEDIKNSFAFNPNIHFLPPTHVEENILLFYHSIDVLTHSSRIGESFGIVIAEAMACGKPVIVNSTPLRDNAQVELVDNGVNGFVVTTARGFADAIERLRNDENLRTTMGVNGRLKVEREYKAQVITKRLEDIYNSVLKGTNDFCISREQIREWNKEYLERERNTFDKQNLSYYLQIIAEHILVERRLTRSLLRRMRKSLTKVHKFF